MKDITCNVIQDLLPLYFDGCCSDDSCRIIENHLADCSICQSIAQEMTRELQPIDTLAVPGPQEEKSASILKKGLKKIRRRWIASLLTVIICIPLCLLAWNQFRGQGLCFTNIHEIQTANTFFKCLKKGDYEGAFRYINTTQTKAYWLEDWFNEDALADFENDSLKYFCDSASELIAAGGITDYHYLASQWEPGGPCYDLIYTATIAEEEYRITLSINDDGILGFYSNGGFSSSTMDVIDHFGLWSEWLWEYYKGCYYDEDTHS